MNVENNRRKKLRDDEETITYKLLVIAGLAGENVKEKVYNNIDEFEEKALNDLYGMWTVLD